MRGSVCSSSHCKHDQRIKEYAVLLVFVCERLDTQVCTFVCAHICLSFYRPRALGPFSLIVLSIPLGRKTREINYVSCWWGFDVKSWGKRCSVTFSLHLLYVIQRVQPPPKSPSPSCCSLPAFRDISHVMKAAHKFDLNLVKKLLFPVLF